MIPNSQMKKILKYYSVVLILVITVFAVCVSAFQIVSNIRNAKKVVEQSTTQLNNYFISSDNKLASIEDDLTRNKSGVDNLYRYFDLEFKDYLSDTLASWDEGDVDEMIYLPTFTQAKVFLSNDNVKEFGISLEKFDDVYYANTKNKLGKKYKKIPGKLDSVRMYRTLNDPSLLEPIGSVFIGFDEGELREITDSVVQNYDLEVFAVSETGQLLYNYNKLEDKALQKIVEKELQQTSKLTLANTYNDYYIFETTNNRGLQIISLISKKSVYASSFSLLAILLLASVVIDLILIAMLFFVFNRYEAQVAQILDGIRNIGEDGLGKRINEESQEAELKEITVGINQMLDRLDQYVEDIYRLDLKQKDAHMMALQSQINPHFLYNTLEYIRMYAVSIGAEELSEVVYSFASLLRNNISQDKESTIQNELLFCEKYVYLYQMRYPNKIAYDFKIDEQLDELILPKFSLQPLIENYFVHGIDYTRKDNAIRVIATQTGKVVTILIEDNGSGMSKEDMISINRKLGKRDNNLGNSIGLANVNARLASYFGDSYYMLLKETVGGGVTVKLSFEIIKEELTHV